MSGQTSLLRAPGDDAHRVSFFELFFDLVYVFAITQLSHGLLEHLDLRGLAETVVLLLAVWWAWVYTTWATNWLNPDSTGCRLMLIGVMGAGLVMATSIPNAFGEGGLTFALAYAAIQVGRSSFVLWAVRDDPVRSDNFQRIVVWNAAAGALWIAGGLASGSARDLIWIVALVVDYAAPAARFVVPGLGRSATSEWTVTASYISERFKLFVILALGESIIVTGATFSELEPEPATVTAFAIAFAGTVAMWWVYFHRSAGAGEEAMGRSGDPGRIARSAYTYSHLPLVAGIIVTAVGDELVIAHPTAHADLAMIGTVLGGSALFLAGHALFKYTVFGVVSPARLVAIAILGALAPVATSFSPLVIAAAAVLVVAGVAVHETLFYASVPMETMAVEGGTDPSLDHPNRKEATH
jgi:low temperature requirement protein LtrA